MRIEFYKTKGWTPSLSIGVVKYWLRPIIDIGLSIYTLRVGVRLYFRSSYDK